MSTNRFENWITASWHNHLQQSINDNTADSVKERLAKAIVVSPDDILEGRVQFGSVVTVFGIEEEEEQTFQIVSYDEASVGKGLLDQASPLAQALFGAREGDVIRVKLANGSNCDYEVTHIRVPKC